MYDVTREELMAAVEAEEREWLSTDDIHPYKSRVPQTKGNTVSFPKITKFNTYLLNHYSAEIVEEMQTASRRHKTVRRFSMMWFGRLQTPMPTVVPAWANQIRRRWTRLPI